MVFYRSWYILFFVEFASSFHDFLARIHRRFGVYLPLYCGMEYNIDGSRCFGEYWNPQSGYHNKRWKWFDYLIMPIIVNLDVVMAERKMSLNELSERVDITPANLSILKTGKARAIRFSTLEAICEVLQCQPGDILEYKEWCSFLLKLLPLMKRIFFTIQRK